MQVEKVKNQCKGGQQKEVTWMRGQATAAGAQRVVAVAGAGGCWEGSGQSFRGVLQMDLLTAEEGWEGILWSTQDQKLQLLVTASVYSCLPLNVLMIWSLFPSPPRAFVSQTNFSYCF